MAFQAVWADTPDETLVALLEVIQDIADFTVVVENYVEGRYVPRPPVVLTDQRNYVQHRLMSLESCQEIESRRTDPVDFQYEACRLACIAYSFLVVFPFPPVVGLFERLSKRMQLSVLRMRTEVDDLTYPRLAMQFWILTLGTIVSVGLPERAWFLSELSPVVLRLGVDQYGSMPPLLQGFLWHPKTSERDGMDVFEDVRRKMDISLADSVIPLHVS